ncbi:VWA domain-containing protein [Rhodococcus sp. ABRD24]|uniref:VWA domain-containing protein n=1 Tax=Rhodococcus sp. ABRD24 TaxID=2507582 RepID=UPI00103F2874|nr:VWA domain-containing protein [Rhodococcus sp. ABRD24]QBJ97701.1 VWA domain-containing protein [Rhodococcus sp. ABRD24]
MFVPAAHADEACTPVVALAMRGSGEPSVGAQKYGSQRTGGWEGPTLERLLKKAYQTQQMHETPIIDVGAGYPAVKVVQSVDGAFDILESAEMGAVAAKAAYSDFRKTQPASCAAPKVILLGYSQGAMVARLTAQHFSKLGVLVASHLVGDPYQKPDADGVFGGGSDGEGIYRRVLGESRDGYYSLPGVRRVSLCHEKDPICDSILHKDESAHMNYYKPGVKLVLGTGMKPSETDEVDFMAKALAASVRVARESYGSGQTSSVAKDTVFAIDTTGSMQPYINNVRSQAADIANRIVSADGRSRVSLVEFRDHGDAFVARTVVPLTSDFSAFNTGLNSLTAYGGGDTPEAVYSGIVEALRAQWHNDSRRSVILLGDAPPHDPEPATGLTSATVTDMLNGVRPLPEPFSLAAAARGVTPESREQAPSTTDTVVAPATLRQAETASVVKGPGAATLYSISASRHLTTIMDPIAGATGGSSVEIANAGLVGDEIMSAIDEIDNQPTASGSVFGIPMEGRQILLSCAGSSASGAMDARFDIDDRGSFDVECVDGIAQVDPLPVGTHAVTLRVRDDRNREAFAFFTIDVPARSVLEEVYPDDTGSVGSSGSLGSAGSGSTGWPWGS